jgi:hypothetical protein
MVALLSSEETPRGAAEVEDDLFLNTASRHIRARRQRGRTEDGSMQNRLLPEARTELLDLLQRLRERHQDWRFGYLVEHLATSSGFRLYDAEDEQLIAASQGDLVRPPG